MYFVFYVMNTENLGVNFAYFPCSNILVATENGSLRKLCNGRNNHVTCIFMHLGGHISVYETRS